MLPAASWKSTETWQVAAKDTNHISITVMRGVSTTCSSIPFASLARNKAEFNFADDFLDYILRGLSGHGPLVSVFPWGLYQQFESQLPSAVLHLSHDYINQSQANTVVISSNKDYFSISRFYRKSVKTVSFIIRLISSIISAHDKICREKYDFKSYLKFLPPK